MDNTLLESSIVLADVMILCALNLGRMRQIFEVHFGIMLCVSFCKTDAKCWIDVIGYVTSALIALHYNSPLKLTKGGGYHSQLVSKG